MDIYQILGYISAIVIGITLGIFGGGGTILTVPVLVYLMRFDTTLAITYSMFIVGLTTTAGSVQAYIKKTMDVNAAFSFGVPSVIMVALTRFLLPTETADKLVILHIGNYALTLAHLLLLLFAVLMIIVSLFMIISKPVNEKEIPPRKYGNILWKAMLVGVISGLLGAGGGFIIVPALIAFYRMDAKKAIGTSLFIIAANSFVGFFVKIGKFDVDWIFLVIFSFIAIVGILIGMYISRRIKATNLKKGFGVFVLIMGIYVLIREIFLK